MFRVIYEVVGYDMKADTTDEMIAVRRFAANKRTADKIARRSRKHGYETEVRKMQKREWAWINWDDVERL